MSRTESGKYARSPARASGAAPLLTAPVPQSLALVEAGNPDLHDETRRELESTSYAPCLALLVLLDGPTGVPEPGGMQIKGEPLDWIGDHQRKGISAAPGVTIHAGPQWSREHFETNEAKVTALLLAFAGERLALDFYCRLVETSLIRWR